MNKYLQDLAWSVLPKEFKEEVKKYYRTLHEQYKDYDGLHLENAKAKVQERIVTLEYSFGIDNLTSDAEGEEMLTVSRKKVQEMFAANKRSKSAFAGTEIASESEQINHVLFSFFGSKCLPDAHEDNFTSKDELNEDNFGKSEPIYHIGQKVVYKKKGTIKIITGIDSVSDETGTSYYYDTKDVNGNNALQFHESELAPCEESTEEPKFKVGQYALMKGKKVEIVGYKSGYLCPYRVHVLTENYGTDVMESELEPYVEPIPPNSGELKSQLVDSQLRLKIAAMAMQGLLASPVDANMQSKSVDYITDASFEYADALISKNKKGGLNENN